MFCLTFVLHISAVFSHRNCCFLQQYFSIGGLSPCMCVYVGGRKWFLLVWCSANIHVQVYLEHWEEKSTACRDEHSHHALMSLSELAESAGAHLFICNLLTCVEVQKAFLHRGKQYWFPQDIFNYSGTHQFNAKPSSIFGIERMPAALALLIMSASYFSPGFALSSHFDSGKLSSFSCLTAFFPPTELYAPHHPVTCSCE